jgi:threonine synthase
MKFSLTTNSTNGDSFLIGVLSIFVPLLIAMTKRSNQLSNLKELRCQSCGRIYRPIDPIYTCKCGGSLNLIYNYDLIAERVSRDDLKSRQGGVWKYTEFLPMESRHKISLGEGESQLVECKRLGKILGFRNLYIKDETRNPTGSFKDRGMTIAISKAVEFGASSVAIASTGSAGGSASAYAAKAGLQCIVLAPTTAPALKVVQIGVFGSRIIRTRGSLDDACDLLEKAVKRFGWHDMTTSLKTNPWLGPGLKTGAYEIADQLDWRSPDWVMVPVGSGSNLTSYWQGFQDFQQLDFIDRLPKMVGTQPSGIAPLVRAHEQNRSPDNIEPWTERMTIASGIGSLLPPDGDTALRAIRDSEGTAVHVSDDDILKAEVHLASEEGIFAEPSGALSVAGAKRLLDAGVIDKDDTVVAVVTGSGLKDPEVLRSNFDKYPVIDPDISELESILSG